MITLVLVLRHFIENHSLPVLIACVAGAWVIWGERWLKRREARGAGASELLASSCALSYSRASYASYWSNNQPCYLQLEDTRTTDRKHTFLSFIADVVQRKFPDVQDFADELYLDGATTGNHSSEQVASKGNGLCLRPLERPCTFVVVLLFTPTRSVNSNLQLIMWELARLCNGIASTFQSVSSSRRIRWTVCMRSVVSLVMTLYSTLSLSTHCVNGFHLR